MFKRNISTIVTVEDTPRYIPNRYFVKKMKIRQSDMCHYCNELDTLQHFFFDCSSVKILWSEIESRLECITNKHIRLSAKNVILGLDTNDNIKKSTLHSLNIIILIGKATISKVKYGNHKNFLVVLEQELNIRKLK